MESNCYDEMLQALELGFNDLNGDGVYDTLLFVWNGKKSVFVSDDGKLPWSLDEKDKDWNDYFNKAFNAGVEPPDMWNEMRSDWGNYSLFVDKDDCGRFDSQYDFYYKALDLNGDGSAEAEFFHHYMGIFPYSSKFHINLDGERGMTYFDFKKFNYENEQRYLPGGKYITNVHGSGFFLHCFSHAIQNAWENPIAWYDFDFDGYTNMVMRAADTNFFEMIYASPGGSGPEKWEGVDPRLLKDHVYRGDITEFEVAFELNSNTCETKYHSLDMQLTFYKRKGTALDYQAYIDVIPKLKGLQEADFLSGKMINSRQDIVRRYIPYMDGYKIGTDYAKWEGVWLLFDEDDDDCRWEEMFSRHETVDNSSSGDCYGYSDRIGDRIERDIDFMGKGNLYIGKFDGRIHLHHAEDVYWDIDYLGIYKGSLDRKETEEGPEPPAGLRYPRVRYYDKNGNGFIDTIEYTTVEYKNEENTQQTDRVISLLDYCDEQEAAPDVCALIDPRVDSKISGWKVGTWDGNPLIEKDFKGTACKDGFDKMYSLYTKSGETLWNQACMLYKTATRHHLNVSEDLDRGLQERYTKEELSQLRDIDVPKGYSRHLTGDNRREKYHNGYWLKEKVFGDILIYSGLDKYTLEKLYYTGRINDLCEFISLHLDIN